MPNYKLHQVVYLFPPMGAREFGHLVESIQRHGQLEPVWTYKGEIIDGRHRLSACQMLGLEVLTREWEGEGALLDFVLGLNLGRRHLNPSQKAVVGYRMLPVLEDEAKERQRRAGGDRRSVDHCGSVVPMLEQLKRHPSSIELAARTVGVSKQYVADVKAIAKVAPDMIEEIEAGTLTIAEAKRRITLGRNKRSAAELPVNNSSKAFKEYAVNHLEALGASQIENVQGLVLLNKWISARLRSLFVLALPEEGSEKTDERTPAA